MKFLNLVFVLLLLVSCAKAPEKCPPSKTGVELNAAGKRLPVAISYAMPRPWLKTGETSAMKFDERVIDPISQAKMKVFYFESMKGMNEANLQRWTNQFSEDDRNLLAQQVLEVNQIPVVEFIMSGTFKDKQKPMDPESQVTLRPKHTMRAYIVETQTGTWFFKAVAPDEVIVKLDSQFKEFVYSIKESF